MSLLKQFLPFLVALLCLYSCAEGSGPRVIASVSELPPPATSEKTVKPLSFEHSFKVISAEELKERIGKIQYMADPVDELPYDKLTGESGKLEQLTAEQALEDVNYLFRLLKHGYAGYGFYNGNGDFNKAQLAIVNELGKQHDITRDHLLSLIMDNLSFIDAGYINIGGRRFFNPSNYYCWDKLDFSRDDERFYYPGSGGEIRLCSVNGHDPAEFMKLSLNARGEPVYHLGIEARSNPGTLTLELAGKGGFSYTLSDNWTDRPFKGGNPAYSRSQQDGVTVITCGSLRVKPEEAQIFAGDAQELKEEKLIVLDIRGNKGGNSGVAIAWVKNLTDSEPVWPDTYTVLTNRTTLAGRINSWTLNPSIPESLTVEAKAKLQSLADGTLKRGWSELEVPAITTIPNPGQLIVVLIDRGTGGADVFVKYLKQFTNVVVVGESTIGGGIFGDNSLYLLPNSGLPVILQYKIFAPADFNGSTSTSIKPDLWVPGEDALARVLAAVKRGWLRPD